MKTIDSIIIHCSATRAGQDLRAKTLTGYINREVLTRSGTIL